MFPDIEGAVHSCRVVQDAHGKKFLLIAGEVLSFDAPLEQNNGWVETFCSALRRGRFAEDATSGGAKIEEAKADNHPWLSVATPTLPNADRIGPLTPYGENSLAREVGLAAISTIKGANFK